MTGAAWLVLAGVAAAAGAGWERVADRDGIVIERRVAPESPLRELRLSAHSPVAPARLMATLWKHEEYPEFVPYLIHLDVLREEGDTKLVYQQVRVPFAKDRDIVARLRRSVADGVYEMTSTAVPDEGPPATDEFIRVRTSRGRWRLVPAPDGGTDVSYTFATDAGGRLPAWVLGLIQKDGSAKMLRAMLDRAGRNEQQSTPP